jgi:hypothetical protein
MASANLDLARELGRAGTGERGCGDTVHLTG